MEASIITIYTTAPILNPPLSISQALSLHSTIKHWRGTSLITLHRHTISQALEGYLPHYTPITLFHKHWRGTSLITLQSHCFTSTGGVPPSLHSTITLFHKHGGCSAYTLQFSDHGLGVFFVSSPDSYFLFSIFMCLVVNIKNTWFLLRFLLPLPYHHLSSAPSLTIILK